MRIKRFIAPDMRTALRMVRDDQGADAVILSNRAIDGGIEIVAATDYDEALVQQALRAAALPTRTAASAPMPPVPVPVVAPAAPVATTMSTTPTAAAAPTAAPPVRESLAARARAVFRIGDAAPHRADATLAELTAPAVAAIAAPMAAPFTATPTRFEEMMAALAPAAGAHSASELAAVAAMTAPAAAAPGVAPAPTSASASTIAAASAIAEPVVAAATAERAAATATAEPAALTQPSAAAAPAAPADSSSIATDAPPAVLPLRLVPAPASVAPDPAFAAMRDEMATMRELIERQMGQYALERLRGSPARAAAYTALLGYGCEDVLAQAVAARIDPQLDPAQIHAPMLAELARMITVCRNEPLDDGGVIALVGPTGAGKTTTAAKLAARFAARHRARDVALVTTDSERAGAREQLHAHGRRLGITVCEAAGPEALHEAIAQLADYPLVLVDTAGFAARDRALFGQILWLRSARRVRSLLVLPANAHPHDLGEVIRRYRPAAPEGVVLTKLDETGRLGSALSVLVRHGLSLAYTTDGQQIPADLDPADASRLVLTLEKLRRAADNPLVTEDRHALA